MFTNCISILEQNIEVNLRDQYVITVEEGPKVNVNDKQQLLDLSHPLLRITDGKGTLLAHVVHTPDNSIHMILPQDKLDLVYHGTSLIIKVSLKCFFDAMTLLELG